MTDVIATKQPKAAEALDDSSLIDVARPHRGSYIDAAYCCNPLSKTEWRDLSACYNSEPCKNG